MHAPFLLFAGFAAVAFAATGCNLIFNIQPGKSDTTGDVGGGGTGGTGGVGGTGAAGGTTSQGGQGGGGTGGVGGTGGTGGVETCVANSASCEGAVLHVCDPDGHPLPDVTCDVVAACDAAGRTCIDAASFGRLSVGLARGCAIEDGVDRKVRCWGTAGGGAIFSGSFGMQPTALEVPFVSEARQISVGGSQICALQDDGTVVCWGYNDSGEAGLPVSSISTPSTVPDLTGVVEVQAANRCTCARRADGTVACWGLQSTGCFGVIPAVEEVQHIPTTVAGVSDAVQLRTGAYETPTCVRQALGTVMCWSETIPPTTVLGVDDAEEIAVGHRHIFIRSKEKGLMFSAPTDDELGWRQALTYVEDEFTSMDAGDTFCALRADGILLCAKLDNPPQPPLPTPVLDVPPGSFAEVAVGRGFTYLGGLQCLRLDATPISSAVYCWGDDAGGALGADAPEIIRSPALVPGVIGATSLATAGQSTAVVLGDGQAVVWGNSGTLFGMPALPQILGELGLDNESVHTDDRSRHAYVHKTGGATLFLKDRFPALDQRLLSTGLTDIDDARPHYLWDVGLRANGAVVIYAAGETDDGETANIAGIFGNGTTTSDPAGELVTVPGITATAIAPFGDDFHPHPAHICALLVGGTVSCWGENFNGEVGSGVPGVAPVTTPAPVTIPGGAGVVSIAAGRRFSCAVTTAGKVYCWGSNESGQLGVMNVQSFAVPIAPVNGISTATAVTAREGHACALLDNTTVKCWGDNTYGQLGNGTLNPVPLPVLVPDLDDVVEISAGAYHTCARHSDGSIHCWGSSYSGQVGTGITGIFPSPLPVVGL